MKTIPRILLIFCFTGLALSTSLVLAEDAVLPPPKVDESTAGEAGDIRGKAPNLQKELQSPEDGEAVDIRAYQRKDGATITEYAVRGRVFKIKVQPAGGLPAYYLYDSDGDGRFEQRLPGGGKRISPPTWVLQEF
jgi:hypothetical protein